MKQNPNICRWIMHAVMIGGIVFAGLPVLIAPLSEFYMIFVAIGGVVACGGLIYGVRTVRCPECGRGLPLHGLWTNYCPHCGANLR